MNQPAVMPMIDNWFDAVRLPISFKQFLALPTNPAYKYEYFANYALLTPRPKSYHASLDLALAEVPEGIEEEEGMTLRPLREDDWDHLAPVFSFAFHRVQPFASLDDKRRLEAARACLDKTRRGGDGAIVVEGCWVAVDQKSDKPVAAAFITLQPQDDGDSFDDRDFKAPLGPHLTWIFVSPMKARNGIGSMLLAAVVRGLLARGDKRLDSTFLLGNESSTLWHWRSGFQLRGYGFSQQKY